MVHSDRDKEKFIIDTVNNNLGIRRTKLKKKVMDEFEIGHATIQPIRVEHTPRGLRATLIETNV